MSKKQNICIEIGNIIPHGNAQITKQIIALWKELGKLAVSCEFSAPVMQEGSSRLVVCEIFLDLDDVLNVMESAYEKAGSFDAYRLNHSVDDAIPVGATLPISISADEFLSSVNAYGIATIFLQQMVLAMNITLPGSVQMLITTFTGDKAHQVEAPVFDSIVFFGARNALLAHDWPALSSPSLSEVWQWLDKCETSRTMTAIKSINKALFTLLKIAEHRQDYSARMVLLVAYLLDELMDCRNTQSFKLLRNRIRLVLGNIPENSDCLKDLYKVRASLFCGDHPVHRPTLIHHKSSDEISEQLDQQDNMVEQGVLLSIALLQDLIKKKSVGFEFKETISRKT